MDCVVTLRIEREVGEIVQRFFSAKDHRSQRTARIDEEDKEG